MAGVGGQREGSEGKKKKNNDGNGKDRSTTAA
jgi:hypothetical protein